MYTQLSPAIISTDQDVLRRYAPYRHLLTLGALHDRTLCTMLTASSQRRSTGQIPFQVLDDMQKHHWSLARSWREYLDLKRETVAIRMGVQVMDYASMERNCASLAPETLTKMANGLGLDAAQLVLETAVCNR